VKLLNTRLNCSPILAVAKLTAIWPAWNEPGMPAPSSRVGFVAPTGMKETTPVTGISAAGVGMPTT
jgi:hypothetical protein